VQGLEARGCNVGPGQRAFQQVPAVHPVVAPELVNGLRMHAPDQVPRQPLNPHQRLASSCMALLWRFRKARFDCSAAG
jgi:hypothetical protein